jgi:hypothetical protein
VLASTSARVRRTWRRTMKMAWHPRQPGRHGTHPQAAHAFRAQVDAAACDLRTQLGDVQAPALILHGVDDRSMPLALAHELRAGSPTRNCGPSRAAATSCSPAKDDRRSWKPSPAGGDDHHRPTGVNIPRHAATTVAVSDGHPELPTEFHQRQHHDHDRTAGAGVANAGSTIRNARSPAAPNRTTIVGSGRTALREGAPGG